MKNVTTTKKWLWKLPKLRAIPTLFFARSAEKNFFERRSSISGIIYFWTTSDVGLASPRPVFAPTSDVGRLSVGITIRRFRLIWGVHMGCTIWVYNLGVQFGSQVGCTIRLDNVGRQCGRTIWVFGCTVLVFNLGCTIWVYNLGMQIGCTSW